MNTSMFKARFLANFPGGMAVGSIVAFGIAWLLDSDIGSSESRNYIYLISALVTLAAASLALSANLANIQNQNKIARQERSSSLVAARSTLPLLLSKLSQVATRGAELSMKHNLKSFTLEERVDEIQLSDEIIPYLKEVIQYADAADAERLSNLIRVFQVLQSRFITWMYENPSPVIVDPNAAVNWAVFFRMVDDCYGYAKNEEEHIPRSLQRLDLREFFSVRIRLSGQTVNNLQPAIQRREAMANPELF